MRINTSDCDDHTHYAFSVLGDLIKFSYVNRENIISQKKDTSDLPVSYIHFFDYFFLICN